MQTLIKLGVAIMVLLFTINVEAQQEFQGEATYKTLTKLDINIDDDGSNNIKSSSGNVSISPEIKKQLLDQIKKGTQQTYTLSFDKEQSLYKKEEQLSAPQPSSGANIRVSFSGGFG